MLEHGKVPGASPVAPAVIDLTHAELMALRKLSAFKQNQWYRVTDFRTRWRSYITGIIHEGTVEPLLVQAVTGNRIALRAYSEQYPNDDIDYIIYDGSLHGERINGVEVPSNDRGGIVRRKDINRNIECWFDFRAYTVRLFETKPGSGVYRHYGSGPAFVDRHLLDIDKSTQVCIKKASIPWMGEDGVLNENVNMGFSNPEHYMGIADKVQIGLNSFSIKIYGNEITNAVFGECTDDIFVEGDWTNSQMLGFNNSVTFGDSVATSIFLGGLESVKITGKVKRSTFLPGVIQVTFNGSINGSVVFSQVDNSIINGDKNDEFIGFTPAASGLVGDAPRDGKMYVRKNGLWVELVK